MFTISKKSSAFTKTAKSEDGAILRAPIKPFEFAINLSFDESNSKFQQIVETLITDAIKADIQAIDRTELFSADVIAHKFTELFKSYDLDKVYDLVCLKASGAYGLAKFEAFMKDIFIPVMGVNPAQAKTILSIVKLGNGMPKASKDTILSWFEKFASEVDSDELSNAIQYLATEPKARAVADLASLGL